MIDKKTLTDLLTADTHGPVFDLVKNYGKNPFLYLQQYNPKTHKIHDPIFRPDKQVFKPNGITKADGTPELREHTVPVARISLPYQQQIVKVASGILCGNPIKLEFTGTDPKFDALKKIWNDNKLDYKSKRLAKLMMAETECAEVWYQKPDPITGILDPTNHSMMILAPSYGDSLYPIFDGVGNMIAFGRSYEADMWNADTNQMQKQVTFLEVYDETNVYAGNNATGTMQLEQNQHGYDKIPIVYYSQEYPEWWAVQESIERVETIISNLSDTNDYFGSPTAVATGNILSYADKGESGKMIQIDDGAKVEYLTWDQVPEAIKMELEAHLKNIFGLTDTVRLNPEELNGVFTTAPSGYAIKLMFMSAHMKASDHEENFGESIQRRINLLKSFVGGEELDIKPEFTYFLPKNDTEDLAAIVSAKNNGILSQQTAVNLNPLIDGDDELAIIQKEQTSNQANDIKKAKDLAAVSKPAAFPVN